MRRLAWSEVLSLRLLGVAVSAMAATAVPSHSQTVRYDYDAAGRLNLVRSAAGEVQYSYDEAANLLQVTVPTAGPLAIAALSPLGGATGTLVTISGSGFATEPGANLVEFNGIGAEVVSASPSSLVVRVPSGAGIGDVSVTVAGRVAWSGVAFDASGAGGGRPVLTSISPTVAAVGATVVVSGMNLMVGGAMPEVTVNGIVAAVSAASNTSLTFTVPLGATTGSVVVRTGNGASAATTVLYLQVDAEGMVTATATVLVGGPAANVTVKADRSAVVHFSATAGEALQVRFSGMGPFGPSATVYGPNGQIVVNCGVLQTASPTCALPAIARSGGHQVVLRAYRDGVASVAVVNTALAAGTSVTVAPGEVKRIEFDGVAGQDIGVGVAALATTPTGQPVRVRILAPGGQVLRDCGAALAAGLVCAPPRLPSSGRYSVELSPSPGVSATLALSWSVARSVGSLAALSPAGGTVLTHQPARPGEPGSVLLDVLPQGVTARVVGRAAIRLFSPGGALLADLSSAATASPTSITSLSIPGSTAGQHTLLVFPLDVATGQVQVSLRRNVGGTITVDGPPVNVSRPATFGVELSFVATATSAGLGVSTAAGASTAFVTATLAPQSVRYFGSCTGSAPGVSCGLLGLVPGQTYLINVSAASNESAGAELAFTLSSDVSARLTVNGGWQPISLQRIGQRARLSFRARAGGNYRVEWRNANFAANGGAFAANSQVQLYAPNGQSVGPFNWINMTFPTAGYNFSGLPQDGLYDIFVGPHATSTGTAEFRVTGDFVPEPGGDESGEIPLLPPWAMAVLAALLLGSIAHRSRAPTRSAGEH